MRLSLRYSCIALLASVAFNACGAQPGAATNPTLLETITLAASPTESTRAPATATITPTEALIALPTEAPTATPTEAPTPTAEPAALQALYPCEGGLCVTRLGETDATRVVTAVSGSLHGYAFSPDGTQIVYGVNAYGYEDIAELYLVNVDGTGERKLFDVRGVESGIGGYEGFGALGLSADSERVIFEDQAQMYIDTLDGSDRYALMDQWNYGASSTHTYMLSPASTRLLAVSTNLPNHISIAHIAASEVHGYDLALDQRAVGWVDETHLLVERFTPPYDPNGGNPAGVARATVAFQVLALENGAPGAATTVFTTDGVTAYSVVSNVAGGQAVLREDFRLGSGEVLTVEAQLSRFSVQGTLESLELPDYDGFSRIALAVR